MRQIITLVGTSVLTNARRALQQGQPDKGALLAYLRSTDETAGSAETNSLQHLLEEDDGITFVHSETPEGFLCSEVLDTFYAYGRHGHQQILVNDLEVRVVPDLNYTAQRFKLRGLRSLVNVLAESIQQAQRRGHSVILNATAGFKAEAAYANLVGMLFKLPVYYIYESFREIVELPPMPLDVDMSLIARHEAFFTWLDSAPQRTPEVQSRLHALEPALHMLLTEDEDCTFLSPVGEALWQTYTSQRHADVAVPWPAVSTREPVDKVRFVRDEPNQPRHTMTVAEQLARLQYIEEVRGGEFVNTTKTRVQRAFQEEGKYKLRVIYSDGDKGVYLTLTTTARTEPQNALVRRQVEATLAPRVSA